jgi:ubiquinone/menaquinone biosynthesis C-methylase UbiE
MADKKTVISNMKLAFDALFKYEKSESLKDIWREVFGEEYPEEVDHDSPVTLTDLKNIAKYLNIKPGETIIDLGCGRGGPGMWVAREVGANYFGFDLSETGIEVAKTRTVEFDLEGKAQFQVGDMCDTGFPDNYFDAAISIGALLFIPDKLKAIYEAARIIRSEAYFVFITVEEKQPQLVNDFRPLIRKAGLEVIVYEEIPDSTRKHGEYYKKVIEFKKQLIKDMGFRGAALWISDAQTHLPRIKFWRRILAVARKP